MNQPDAVLSTPITQIQLGLNFPPSVKTKEEARREEQEGRVQYAASPVLNYITQPSSSTAAAHATR